MKRMPGFGIRLSGLKNSVEARRRPQEEGEEGNFRCGLVSRFAPQPDRGN